MQDKFNSLIGGIRWAELKNGELKNFPKNYLKYGTNLNLTQDELVKRLGLEGLIYRNNISEYESGKRQPPMPIVLAYARLAGISTDVLIDDELDLPENLLQRSTKLNLKFSNGINLSL